MLYDYVHLLKKRERCRSRAAVSVLGCAPTTRAPAERRLARTSADVFLRRRALYGFSRVLPHTCQHRVRLRRPDLAHRRTKRIDVVDVLPHTTSLRFVHRDERILSRKDRAGGKYPVRKDYACAVRPRSILCPTHQAGGKTDATPTTFPVSFLQSNHAQAGRPGCCGTANQT
jgi:hypothetical protein